MKRGPPTPEGNGATSNLNDPPKELKEHLADFLLSLIQAFLRTGYYTPDHREAKAAKEGLYEDFQRLLGNKGELTFLARDDVDGKSILIEGVLPEPHQLDAVMIKGMAEIYTPKFITFLTRKDLISLTIKAAMSWIEFDSFIDLMGEPTFLETHEKSDKERFVQALQEKGIFNISYIFNEELLAGERSIPWRSKIALSRLKKDFKTVPLYQNLDVEGLKRVRRQIIQDMARPINKADVVYPILLNSDLAETEEFKEPEIDEEIIACISDRVVIQVSRALLNQIRGQERGESLRRKQGQIAKLLASSLNLRDINGREPILEEFFKRELIPAGELPKAVQLRIIREKHTEEFLSQPDFYLRKFDKVKDTEKYVRFVKYFLSIIPELIRRDRYKEILGIITHLCRHVNDENPLSAYAEQALEVIGKEKILGILKAKFMGGQRETCLAIGPIFLKLGKRSIPHLRSFMEKSDDQLVIKSAFELLFQIDPDAINTVFHTVDRKQIPTGRAIRFIRALSEIKDEAWEKPLDQILRAYVDHENPRLREEASRAYYKIMGNKGETLYLTLLNDPDVGVQKSAVQCLGRIKSQVALEKFLGMLKEVEDVPSDRVRHIEATLLNALSHYGNIETPGEARSLEEFLLEMLNSQLSLGPLKFLRKKKTTMSTGSIAAICETLGKIGTVKSCDILQKVQKENEDLLKRKAEEALVRIGERENGPPSQ
jgi:hypothetical protein